MKKGAKFILVIAVILIIFSAARLTHIALQYRTGKSGYSALEQSVIKKAPAQQSAVQGAAPLSVDFTALLRQNPDTAAWLYSENTAINYPVMYSGDNEKYLRALPDLSYYIGGTPFIDFRCAPDFSCRNTIIYGHHMYDGSMFGSLKAYKEQSYYESHPELYILTPEKSFAVRLLYGYVTYAGDKNTYTVPETDEDTKRLAEYAAGKSLFHSATEYEYGARLVTLSTCSKDFSGARFVLIGEISALN